MEVFTFVPTLLEENNMKYAIIAAGEGSRLATEGVADPKPLVRIHGECLIDRLLRVFMQNGADEICVICNEQMVEVAEHLHSIASQGLRGKSIPLRLKVKSTPSSMHSFYELSPWLEGSNFVLTTVDTIFKEEEFRRYVADFQKAIDEGLDGLMGVTDYIDDEKPLYVGVNETMGITGFYDDNSNHCRYISGGIYGLSPVAIDTLRQCVADGESRMRNFQRGLIRDGRSLQAFAFSKVLDIDHATDIAKAEDFLARP